MRMMVRGATPARAVVAGTGTEGVVDATTTLNGLVAAIVTVEILAGLKFH